MFPSHDPSTNYDPNADTDDGSCEYPGVPGCTSPIACNYNENATFNDGSCVFCNTPNGEELCNAYWGPGSNYWEFYSSVFDCIEGCTDPLATNYNPDADIEDNSCEYDNTVVDTIYVEFPSHDLIANGSGFTFPAPSASQTAITET